MTPPVPRRTFLLHTAAATALPLGLAASRRSRAAEPAPMTASLTAAVIGHTGRGDYGHGLDLIFRDPPGIRLLAVADPDPQGRARAMQRTGAPRAYADYRELLEREKPRLVSLAMRHADQHHPIALACLQAGAHLYVEKPFTSSPDLAEALCTEAERRGLKIAVAHTMRLAPAVQRLHRAIRDGLLGDIAEIRAHGKQDTRAGGEDMMVLGSHLFDLMRLLAGDPVSASARITTAGRPITRSDRRLTRDNVGWVAGDRVFASFGFDHGVIGTFTSDARLRTATGHWGMRILGSKATARILADLVPRVEIQLADATPWTPLEDVAPMTADNAQRPVVEDWLESVRGAADHVPACSGRNGAWAVRMVTATYESALESRTVSFAGPAGSHPLDP